MLAHVPSSGRNPRGSSAFLAYPVPKACMHVLGTGGSEVLGCRTLRLESQSSAGLGMQPYPRAPDLVWPGHVHGNGCLSARAMDTGFLPELAHALVYVSSLAGVSSRWVWQRA